MHKISASNIVSLDQQLEACRQCESLIYATNSTWSSVNITFKVVGLINVLNMFMN
jgi:hypothetical protein